MSRGINDINKETKNKKKSALTLLIWDTRGVYSTEYPFSHPKGEGVAGGSLASLRRLTMRRKELLLS